jgi:hypothetical protein
MTVTLQTPFVYTGAGFNVAYSWENTGPYTNAPVDADCSNIFTGIENYGEQYWTMFSNSSVSAPNNLGGYYFCRPAFKFGGSKLYSNDTYIVDAHVPGKILSSGNSEATIVYVGNSGISSAQNVSVSMVCGGVNSYTATQVIPSIPASSTQSISFNAFNPTLSGLNTISLSILNSDQSLQNNAVSLNQSVTCNEVCSGFNSNGYSGAYFSGGMPDILAIPFTSPITRTLTSIKLRVSNYPNSNTVTVSGVLTDATGSIIATTNTFIASAAALMNMPLTSPYVMSPNVKYYYGVQVDDWNAYPIAADVATPLTPAQAFEIPIGGGTPIPLLDDMGYVYGVSAVFNYSAPAITTTGNKYSCAGSAVTLTATSVTGYSWATGATTNSLIVYPVITSTYYVRTFNTQCNTNASVAVFVSPIPSPSIVGSPTICQGSSKVYNALGAWSYTWDSGSNATQDVFTASQSGIQSITLSASNVPCPPVSASFQVQVKPAPSLQIISPYPTLCNTAVGGKTLQLTGQPLGGVFSGSNVSSTGVITPSANGVLTAFYSYTNVLSTCSATTNIQLSVSNCTGLESNLLSGGIKVYPNPSSDGLFQIEMPEGAEIKLYGLDGRCVPVMLRDASTLDASALASGVYLLEIKSESNLYQVKLIKQ